MALIIKNANVANSYDRKDILIEAGVIKKISKSGEENPEHKGAKIIDATDKIILPGAIDCHVHVREPGLEHKEDFSTASRAAAAGGISTMCYVKNANPPMADKETILKVKELARQKSIINVSIHGSITPDNINRLDRIKDHVCGFKLVLGGTFGTKDMIRKDSLKQIFRATMACDRCLMIHAEDSLILKKAAMENSSKWINHPLLRPPEAEIEAISEIVKTLKAVNAKVHITHVSTRAGVELIRYAKNKGLKITADTTPNYLLLTNEDFLEKGPLLKVNPPLRSKKDQDGLWAGLKDGTIDCLATDHAPHTLQEKRSDNPPSGIPGLDTFMPLMISCAVEGRISFERLSELTGRNPAKIWRFNNRGELKAGLNADLIMIDPEKVYNIRKEKLFTKCGWSPYEGWKLKGKITATIVNGNIVFEDN